jgi:tetratricopeptide (TPR) repeat protein
VRSAEDLEALEANLERARADFEGDPEDPDHAIWLGRRLGYLERYREAIEVFSKGAERHPGDPRFFRHRGHRYISMRRFEEAVADLERAAALVAGRPAQIEPDGIPSARGEPTTTTQFNVYYHLGLARYLLGDYRGAADAYRECLEWSRESDENLVATSDWLYMTLMRLGRGAEARTLLEPIHADMDVIDSRSYLERLLLYKGERSPEDLLDPVDPLDLATQGYGVANWRRIRGEEALGRALLERVLEGDYWPAFGYIAAEADLARTEAE